ncbi:MAG: hypothetical protein LW630_10880 [Saprospiraceae bacterium]|jgi:trigger factor|nr:hypothetical protein [Saprospiraceae bacterium]
MQVVRKDADALHLTLELTLEPEDYAGKFEQELKKYKNQAQMKGFRKGMTPMSVVKKMAGKNILLDVINDTLQEKLFGYLDEHKMNYLGQPLPVREENYVFQLEVNQLKPYTFAFEIGLAPEVDVQGVSENDSYNWYDVTIPDTLIEEELQTARRRFGKRTLAEDTILEMDILKIEAVETQNGEILDGGWTSEFSILVNIIKDERVKHELLTKKVGDTIDFDVYTLEDNSESHVDKYLLKLPDNLENKPGSTYRGTIIEASRVELAELNEEFFGTFGDPGVTDEVSLRQFLHHDLKKYYDNQASQFMYRDIMDALMEKNTIPLPEAFLKRYLKETSENVTDEVLETEFDAFAKNMKWSLQKSSLAKRFDIEVVEEDLRRHFANAVFSYMRNYGNMDYSFISSTVDRLMKDKDQVNKAYEEVLADRVFQKIEETVQKKHVAISQEDFVEKVKELNKQVNNL